MPGYDVSPGGEGGGTSDHTALTNREAAEGHPATAVSYDGALGMGGPATDVQAALDEVTAAVGLGLAGILGVSPDAGGLAITTLADPTDPQDAATRAYADAAGAVVLAAVDPGAIGAGRIWINSAGTLGYEWQHRNATDDGWDPVFLAIAVDGTKVEIGGELIPIDVVAGAARIGLALDGTIVLTNDAAGPTPVSVTLAVDGSLEVNSSGIVKLNLPTVDPAVAGALYSNAGVVMVSAG